ncbi:hypothetical protein QBC42DRAFT_314995 [Cladorrhinum samala]|uniref:Uncharacterized protein n=1 Tax=Cladorrhinum samala TaxID=585594 RepID=A0AAV9HCF5_9PEZI|nr:hypothetical protein QBC42DRAFT_314995 [Cladorrhinum samala]
MKSTTYLLAALACGVSVEARLAHGEKVVARQGWGWGGGGGSGGGDSSCTWTGHCIGDACETNLECDGDLDCVGGKCANPGTAVTTSRGGGVGGRPTTIVKTTTVYVYPTTSLRTTARTTSARPVTTAPAAGTCGWTGHCIGDPCTDENDCDNDYICSRSRCAAPGAGTTVVTTTRRVTTTSVRRTTTTAATPPRPTATTAPGGGGPKCDNPLSCIGVSCTTDADCGFDLIICKNGFCGL